MSRALGFFSMRVTGAKKIAGVLTKRMATWMLADSVSGRLRT